MFDPKKHNDKYRRIQEYKYAIEHNQITEEIVKKKLEYRKRLEEMKRKLEKNQILESPRTLQNDIELNEIERDLIRYFRKLNKNEQEYFYHAIACKVLEKEWEQ